MKIKLISVILTMCLFAACNLNQTQNPDESSKTGDLILGFSMDQTRTLIPSISMEPVNYIITGTGLKGDTFSRTTSDSSMTITGLKFDTWTVTVNAENTQGVVIGSGTSTADVHPGEQTIVNISVTPLTGTGRLSISAYWNASDIEYPTIVSELIPQTGSSNNLDFTISGTTASYTNSAISTGYYTLIVKLFDGNPANITPLLSTGIVEVVRIIKDQLTEGSFAFTNLNPIGGNIQVLITPEMADPIDITITGQEPIIVLGGSMTVTASVPSETGNFVYVWYINGESIGTGESCTVTATAVGTYNLSVTAFTPDGKRGGSVIYEYKALPLVETNMIQDFEDEAIMPTNAAPTNFWNQVDIVYTYNGDLNENGTNGTVNEITAFAIVGEGADSTTRSMTIMYNIGDNDIIEYECSANASYVTNTGTTVDFSNSTGLSFYVKGTGLTQFQVGIATTEQSNISEYNVYNNRFQITEEWQQIKIPWNQFIADDWGNNIPPIDPSQIKYFTFAVLEYYGVQTAGEYSLDEILTY